MMGFAFVGNNNDQVFLLFCTLLLQRSVLVASTCSTLFDHPTNAVIIVVSIHVSREEEEQQHPTKATTTSSGAS